MCSACRKQLKPPLLNRKPPLIIHLGLILEATTTAKFRSENTLMTQEHRELECLSSQTNFPSTILLISTKKASNHPAHGKESTENERGIRIYASSRTATYPLLINQSEGLKNDG
ncbi:unnamed protein product [Linum tenue]|uniref:Uncharacterized protein n=1 Tax=Linum tenue TaxID=586396 RepID=A0AAV0KJ87_9ROSI|nr:unnamed protein product [Linum tenue]